MSKWDHSNCQILAPNMINPIREANIIREIFYTVRTQGPADNGTGRETRTSDSARFFR
jgi:hypothetical protein